MKKILVFAVIINAVAVSLLLSCFFEAERDNLYDPKSADYVPKTIYMFASSLTDGIPDTGGRTGADAMCETQRAMLYNLPSAHVHAFISVNSSDEIRDMPANYNVPTYTQILGPTGTEIAENWNDLISRTFINTPYDAGVTSETVWWSGSTIGGIVGSNTCNEWNSGTSEGNTGLTNDSADFYYISTYNCGLTNQMLCICWE